MRIDMLNGLSRINAIDYDEEPMGFIGKKARARREARQKARQQRKMLKAQAKAEKNKSRAVAIREGRSAGQSLAKGTSELLKAAPGLAQSFLAAKTGAPMPQSRGVIQDAQEFLGIGQQAQEQEKGFFEKTVDWVKANPVPSAGIAAGIAFAAYKLMPKKKTRKRRK